MSETLLTYVLVVVMVSLVAPYRIIETRRAVRAPNKEEAQE